MIPEEYVKASMDESFLMPLKVINEIEKLYDSRKNESKIMSLLNANGTDICNSSEHREFFESIEWKHMGNDDEFEHHENCLGCGGIIEK